MRRAVRYPNVLLIAGAFYFLFRAIGSDLLTWICIENLKAFILSDQIPVLEHREAEDRLTSPIWHNRDETASYVSTRKHLSAWPIYLPCLQQ